MAAKHFQLRPGRVGRLLLRAVFDQPAQPPREPVVPVTAAKLPVRYRLDGPESRDREMLRA